ncbi:MAG: hypothetical protein ACRCTQ_06270 [Brevinemataceae bacterium]
MIRMLIIKYLFLLFVLLNMFVNPIVVYSQNRKFDITFDQADQSFKNKQYGAALKLGADSLNGTFQILLDEAYTLLPYTSRSVITNNKDYSLDIQNRILRLNMCIQYSINYQSLILENTLIYSFEQTAFYLTYIEGVQYFDYPDDELEIRSFPQSTLKYYFWNKKENTAYYVHPFPIDRKKNNTQIPGLLLSIKIKSGKNSTNYDDVVKHMIQKVSWDKLQKLFMERL